MWFELLRMKIIMCDHSNERYFHVVLSVNNRLILSGLKVFNFSGETDEKYDFHGCFVLFNILKMKFVTFKVQLTIPRIIISQGIERGVSQTGLITSANHIFATSANTIIISPATITPSSTAAIISNSVSLAEGNAVDACTADSCSGSDDESSLLSGNP